MHALGQSGDWIKVDREGDGDVGGGMIRLLGGNQGDRVSIATYPENGKKGAFTYRLLSMRRG